MTPLTEATALADELGLERLWLKDESNRFGLAAFKVLGASWAVYRALCGRLSLEPDVASTPVETVRKYLGDRPRYELLAATDGNHGRAVAWSATLFGCSSRILVPAGTAPARIESIRAEGATVEVFAGSYDDAVAAAAAAAGGDDTTIIVADTGWEDYAEVPRWVADGYGTVFHEIHQQLAAEQSPAPDVVVVQIGVGALASAAIAHYAAGTAPQAPELLGVEPLSAACAFETALAAESVFVPGPHPSVMVGLNAGVVSSVALPELARGINAYVAISDEAAAAAVRLLAEIGIKAGETGAAGLAGLLAVQREAQRGPSSTPWKNALVLVTEGITDPASYERSMATVR
jgi:diaminopropionate ammonia-lyase